MKTTGFGVYALLLAVAAMVALPTAGWGATYRVGPQQELRQLGDVPWYALQPGDTVYIYYRPDPYYEKVLISTRGTASQWIRVIGVPGPKGELPVISGNNATTSKNMHYRWQDATGSSSIQSNGVLQIAPGTSGVLPGYIDISNLQVQDGYRDYRFTAENGTVAPYAAFAACVYARSAQHLVVRNSVMANCGLGFYNWTGSGSNWWDGLASDIVVQGNYFMGNGVVGDYSMHQIYTESDGVVIEYNRFGPMRAGSLGSQVKDRSAGTVVRYNYVEGSAGWMIDLVEPQGAYAALGKRPSYSQAFVYGNVLFNNGGRGSNMVHWNEDMQMNVGRALLPNGRLFFFNNTVVQVTNQSAVWSLAFFNTTYGGYECPPYPLPGVIDVRNNIFAVLPAAAGPLPQVKFSYCPSQNMAFGKNWVSPGWTIGTTNTMPGVTELVTSASNNPGFVDLKGNDYHLVPGAGAALPTGDLPAEATANLLALDLRPTLQYVHHQKVTDRPLGGIVGAFALPQSWPAAPTNVKIVQ